MVFNTTFNNSSATLWPSVLLVEETGVPRENHWPVTSHWQTLSHKVVSCHKQEVNFRCERHWLHRHSPILWYCRVNWFITPYYSIIIIYYHRFIALGTSVAHIYCFWMAVMGEMFLVLIKKKHISAWKLRSVILHVRSSFPRVEPIFIKIFLQAYQGLMVRW
jgi:hypothetical protein